MDWFTTPECPEPSQLDILLQRLDDAITFCCPLVDVAKPESCLRTLVPLGDARCARRVRVEAIASERRSRLKRPFADRTLLPDDRSRLAQGLKRGRVLAFLVDVNLHFGLETGECGGYIDENNCPPADTWLVFWEAADMRIPDAVWGACLFAWVPAEFVDGVQRAIDVNPECCLLWADLLDNALGQQLRHFRTQVM